MQSNEVVADLAAGQRHSTASNRLQHLWLCATQINIFAHVSKDEKLMQMHSTAEQFDPATERLFIPFQVFPLFAC